MKSMKNQELSKQDRAVEYFNRDFSCSQSIFAVYGPPLIKPETALRIGDTFASGMGAARTCGAVTGALMALGLHYGRERADDLEAKEKCRAMAAKFLQLFEQRFGCSSCKELLGYDISIPEEKEKAREKELFDTECPKFVREAGKILEEIMD